MKIFALDLWHDLREKRLWPVALVLAVALVAIPVVLRKPAETAAPATVQPVRTAPDPKDLKALATVKLDESGAGRGSSLGTFDPSDPFRPPKKVTKASHQESGAESTVTGNQSAAPTGDSGSAGGGTTAPTGGGETGSAGGGTTAPTGGGETGSQPKQTVRYRYVVDVTFTANGRERRIKGVERLSILPSEASPLLLFLGVTPSAENAVFLVDSTLQAAGDGRCKPTGSQCAFLYLSPGSEQEFTNETGDSYTLRIDEIRKVRIDGTASAKRAKRARAAVGAPPEPRHFASPLIADETASSGGDADSTDHQDSR